MTFVLKSSDSRHTLSWWYRGKTKHFGIPVNPLDRDANSLSIVVRFWGLILIALPSVSVQLANTSYNDAFNAYDKVPGSYT